MEDNQQYMQFEEVEEKVENKQREEQAVQNKAYNDVVMKSVLQESMVQRNIKITQGLKVHDSMGTQLPITEILEKYNKDYPNLFLKVPADYQMAINHRDAAKFGYLDILPHNDEDECVSKQMINHVCKQSEEKAQEIAQQQKQRQTLKMADANLYSKDKLCECCFKYSNLTEFSLGCNTRELEIFGVGYPLFFVTVNYIQWILFIIFLTSGLYNLISFVLGNSCESYMEIIKKKHLQNSVNHHNQNYIKDYFKKNDYCYFSVFTFASYANILARSHGHITHTSNHQIISDILNLTSILVIIVMLYALRYRLLKLVKEIDEKNYTAGDYTALVEGISLEYAQKLFNEIKYKTLPDGIKPECVQIQYIYDYKGYYEINQQQQEKSEQYIRENKEFIQEAIKKKDNSELEQMEQYKTYYNEQKEMEKEIEKIQQIYLRVPTQENQKQEQEEQEQEQEQEKKKKRVIEFKNMALVTFNWEGNKEGAIYFQTDRYKLIEKIRRIYIEYKNNCCKSDNNNVSRQVEDGNIDIDQQERENQQKYSSADRSYPRLGEDEDHPLKFSQADEPLDIIWKNLPYKNEMFYERIKIKFYIFLLVCINTVLSYTILSTQAFVGDKIQELVFYIQDQQSISKMSFMKNVDLNKVFFSIYKGLLSLVVVAMNFIIDSVIYNLVVKEKRYSMTKQDSSYMVKNTILQFINTSLIQFLLTVFVLQNYFQEGGLIESQSMVFISNAVVPIIMSIINSAHITKFYNSIKYNKPENLSSVNQFQLNELLEYPIFNQSGLYAAMLKDLFFTCFYSVLIPGGIVINFIGVSVIYWVHKYNLLRKSSFKHTLSCKLSTAVIDMMEYTVLIYAISNFLFQYILSRGSRTIDLQNTQSIKLSYISMTGAIIALVNTLIPSNYLVQYIIKNESFMSFADKAFKETFLDFDSDYMLDNPSIRQTTFNNYMKNYKEFISNQSQLYKTDYIDGQHIKSGESIEKKDQ